jgi:hypothetical protein
LFFEFFTYPRTVWICCDLSNKNFNFNFYISEEKDRKKNDERRSHVVWRQWHPVKRHQILIVQ